MATWKPPTHCPVGHALVVGNVTRGWMQCGCEKAHRPPKNPAGHDYVRCLTCQREIRAGGCDQLVDGHPIPEPRPPWAIFKSADDQRQDEGRDRDKHSDGRERPPRPL